MKTTAKILVGTATVALFSLSVNAQNTKAVKVNFKAQLAELVSNNVETAVNDLSAHLENLKAAVWFTPADVKESDYAMEETSGLNSVLSELEADLKYKPSKMDEPVAEYNETKESLEEVMTELQSTVKFVPAESMVNEPANELKEILDELSKDVKYTPAAVI